MADAGGYGTGEDRATAVVVGEVGGAGNPRSHAASLWATRIERWIRFSKPKLSS